MITRTRFIVGAVTIAALFTTACSDAVTSPTRAQPPAFAAQGGVGGGGGIAGGGIAGGGGGGTVATTNVVSYTSFGPAGAIAASEGWGATGVESTGFYEDLSFQFSPTVTGSVTNLKLLVQKSFTNVGSDAYSVLLFTDNATVPNTIGTLIGTFQGKATPLFSAPTPSFISTSNGPRLQAGSNYWIRVVPALNSQVTWWAGTANVYGWHFYETLLNQNYILDSATGGVGVQGAFEITVKP